MCLSAYFAHLLPFEGIYVSWMTLVAALVNDELPVGTITQKNL